MTVSLANQGSSSTVLQAEKAAHLQDSLDPGDWEAQRELAHRMLDRMLDFQRDIADGPVWRPVSPWVESRL